MATKYRMRYGQYTSEVAKQLSLDNLGTVVYSGKTCEIWIDGKCIAANFSQSVDNLKEYIDNKINELLGGEGLDKTLDTIKEIQDELLKSVKHFVKYSGGSDSDFEIVEVSRVSNGNGYDYVDSDENVVATEDENGNVTYEEGYSDLENKNIIDILIERINDNKEEINNLKSKNFVTDITVDENKNNEFVKSTSESTTDESGVTTKHFTIGVQYGTFKTGHGNVMNPNSEAYVDGIATVSGVQNYMEERMCWDEFVSDAESVVSDINNNDEEVYTVPDNVELDENIVIGE